MLAHTQSLPLRLARLAASPAPARQAPPKALIDAALAGKLTRANTVQGTAGRQAALRAEYVTRLARHPGVTARRAVGHRPAPVGMKMSALIDGQRPFNVFDTVTRSEARRIARYDALTSNLLQGKISSREFRRRVGHWRPIRGERFLADPDVVIATLDERRQVGDDVFVYERGKS